MVVVVVVVVVVVAAAAIATSFSVIDILYFLIHEWMYLFTLL